MDDSSLPSDCVVLAFPGGRGCNDGHWFVGRYTEKFLQGVLLYRHGPRCCADCGGLPHLHCVLLWNCWGAEGEHDLPEHSKCNSENVAGHPKS